MRATSRPWPARASSPAGPPADALSPCARSWALPMQERTGRPSPPKTVSTRLRPRRPHGRPRRPLPRRPPLGGLPARAFARPLPAERGDLPFGGGGDRPREGSPRRDRRRRRGARPPRGALGLRERRSRPGERLLRLPPHNRRGCRRSRRLPAPARDPILALSHVVVALQSLVSRRLDPMHPGVFSVGWTRRLCRERDPRAGRSRRHAAHARAARPEPLRQAALEIVETTARAHGCTARVEVTEGEPATMNDDALAATARALRGRLRASSRLCAPADPTISVSTAAWRRP